MNPTIAVAAITAGSTLCGAALTGGFTLWLHSRQVRSQRVMAREESRRTAYATFLTSATQVWTALDAVWSLRPPSQLSDPAPAEFAAAEGALKELDQALHVAVLHGPAELTRPAGDIYFKAVEEYTTATRLLLDGIGRNDTAAQMSGTPKPDRAGRVLQQAVFVAAARTASGGD
ncbi:hypothetical protein [Streptomyces sp. adm13(2018)]|uniref:hypothetical protein n=1 Tax=Streptomyces sp. adm13(2018) TaxID=2479007 RepID=UPI0011CE3BD8|nr:hypothetical protein [Streptomyces sp. adm13(2018)]